MRAPAADAAAAPVQQSAQQSVRRWLDDAVAVQARCLPPLVETIAGLATAVADVVTGGGKLLLMGNGGSAAQAQHTAAELVGRFARERQALPALCLDCDTSILTAVANDYGYAEVFARQVRALAGPGDLVLGLSTSGRSENVVRGLAAARERGAATAALVGPAGSAVCRHADHVVAVGDESTARVQEMHLVILHALCDVVEARIAGAAEAEVESER